MKFQYFPDTDMLYIQLMPGVTSESQEVAPGVVVDFDAKDHVIGIEIEDASTILDLSELQVVALPIAHLVVADRALKGASPLQVRHQATALAEPQEAYRAPDRKPKDTGE